MTKQQLELLDKLMDAKVECLRETLTEFGDPWHAHRRESTAYTELYKLTEEINDE
jgi:hypothetical protein